MPESVIVHFMQNCTQEEKISFHVAYQCAPVLKKLKIANTITVPKGMKRQIENLLGTNLLTCVSLYSDDDREVLLITRKDELIHYLGSEEIMQYLETFGYQRCDYAYVISHLMQRFRLFHQKKRPFPHELGILLEYPKEDIQGFIENDGHNAIAMGYWKVYHNLEQAKATFEKYDEALEECLEQIIAGQSLKQIIVA